MVAIDLEEEIELAKYFPIKVCATCGEEKPREEFHKNSRHKDGLAAVCRVCAQVYNAKWRAENREKYLADKAAYREKNRARTNAQAQEYRDANKEAIKERDALWRKNNKATKQRMDREWRINNRDRRQANEAKRRAKKLQATPSWADFDKILEFYTESRKLTEETGVQHTVDHIIPLVSPLVCGLHCEANMQILPYYENSSKSNKLLPEFSGWDSLDVEVPLAA